MESTTTPVERVDWHEYKRALKVIAQSMGSSVQFQPKKGCLRVTIDTFGTTQDQAHALGTIESLVGLVTEFPDGFLERLASVACNGDEALRACARARLAELGGTQPEMPDIPRRTGFVVRDDKDEL